MGKVKIGSVKRLTLVEGDSNLLTKDEILISREEGYTILRKRLNNGELETYVIIPLKDFSNEISFREKVEEA